MHWLNIIEIEETIFIFMCEKNGHNFRAGVCVYWLLLFAEKLTSAISHQCLHGPLTRYVKLRIAHAPGMSGTFSPPPTSKETASCDSGMHYGTCVTRVVMHVGIATPRWRGKCSRYSMRMHNPQINTYLERGPLTIKRSCWRPPKSLQINTQYIYEM